ncbi:MAG: hypothetical protein JXA69_05950, partial [Phycisphaerae bacterium]|nr:hypothetical protein [Phycisphaerae bacterium]
MTRRKNTVRWLVVLTLAVGACMSPRSDTEPRPADDVLVGVEYFAGWWEPRPNKWQDATGADWRSRFPKRVPLLGEYNTQDTMDREIVAAATHGVDFFLFLWYPHGAGPPPEPHSLRLNDGLTYFRQSPEAHRMQFAIEYCNHPPFTVTDEAHWARCVEVWIEAMRHPSYLRVGGRAVFKVHGARYFLQQAGDNVDGARARLDTLRQAARDAGLGELLIGGGVVAPDGTNPDDPLIGLFDFFATYMQVPGGARTEADRPYEELAVQARNTRRQYADGPVPYVPYVPAGWNPRPWPDPRPYFALPTRAEWQAVLAETKADLAAEPMLGFPLPDGGRQKALTIYAWNEFGEGGIVAPTRGDGTMKL